MGQTTGEISLRLSSRVVFNFLSNLFDLIKAIYTDLRPTEEERHKRELRRISRDLQKKENKIRDSMVNLPVGHLDDDD